MSSLFNRVFLIGKVPFLRNIVGRNLGNPEDSFIGRMVKGWFVDFNAVLERNAVEQLQIKQSDKILELGFGPGLGLQHAAKLLKVDEGGKLYGVDISLPMVEEAEKRLSEEIQQGLLHLYQGSVSNLPFNNVTFNGIFHCNCFYFWPSIPDGCQELYRVLKPGGLMVTTLNIDALKQAKSSGVLKGYTDCVGYMSHLEGAGFTNVNIKYLKDDISKGYQFQCIYATKPIEDVQ